MEEPFFELWNVLGGMFEGFIGQSHLSSLDRQDVCAGGMLGKFSEIIPSCIIASLERNDCSIFFDMYMSYLVTLGWPF